MTTPRHGEAVLAEIAKFWARSITTAEIGRLLCISKNSVCRLARDARLRGDPRFPERVQPPREPTPPRLRARRSKAPPLSVSALVIAPAPPARGPFRVVELQPHHCRYAVFSGSERGDHRFCGEPRQANSPYCAVHHVLCNPASTHYAKRA